VNIALASDHGGFDLKEDVVRFLNERGHHVVDVGCFSEESVDYPDFAQLAIEEIAAGKCQVGILICGTGIGMSIVANRHMLIRAANCYDEHSAKMSREHNNANVLCLGARVMTVEMAHKIIDVWLASEFTGGRHQKRIDKFSR
jgi:ribose 5-phosphate isomerase B